jgi:hypothetical protein
MAPVPTDSRPPTITMDGLNLPHAVSGGRRTEELVP